MKAASRVVSALLAALVVPALYFLNLIHYIIELKVTEGYLNDNITTQELINIITDFFQKNEHKGIGTHLAASVITISESTCPRFLPKELGLDIDVEE